MDDGGTREEQEREAALEAFKQRQRPPQQRYAPRPTSETDPVGVLIAAVLGLVALTGIGALLVGSEHVVLGVIVMLLQAGCALAALVAGVAAGVEWGMRRSRQQQAPATGPE